MSGEPSESEWQTVGVLVRSECVFDLQRLDRCLSNNSIFSVFRDFSDLYIWYM